ncbi:MAG: hypothetical protein PUC73_05130 [Lachnospiraceae bacterium]|nr:hypothetical protein [Lachnospiraceae bacterium]
MFADFLFTAFVVSLIGLSFYTIRKPSVKQGIISKKEQKGQTYTHTVVDEAKNIICVYRTLKETSYQENDIVFVLNDSYLIKERSELCEA